MIRLMLGIIAIKGLRVPERQSLKGGLYMTEEKEMTPFDYGLQNNGLSTQTSRPKTEPVNANPFDTLVNRMLSQSVGFDYLANALGNRGTSFPHYDIVKQDDNTYVVQMALAGYSPEDVEVLQDDWNLLVRSKQKQDQEDQDQSNGDYLHRGIAKRQFNVKLSLGRFAEVTNASMKDGLLYVTVKQNKDSDNLREVPIEK